MRWLPICLRRSRAATSRSSALNLHATIDQIPRVVYVVATTQRPILSTPVATYEFFKIQADLFGGFTPYRRTRAFDIATPEKALFDILYFSAIKAVGSRPFRSSRCRQTSRLPKWNVGSR